MQQMPQVQPLTVSVQTAQVVLGPDLLPVSRHWAYFYGLLALRALEGGEPWVTCEEVNALPTWTEVQARSVGTSLFRHAAKMRGLGYELLISPPGEGTKRFALDPQQVRVTGTDAEDLRRWLSSPLTGPVQPDSTRAARLMVLAETSFEQGRTQEAEQRVLRALDAEPGVDQHLRALALLAWIRTVGATHAEGQAAVHTLKEQLALYQQAAKTSGDTPSRAVQALVHIQTARFHLRKQQARSARAAYLRATQLLGEHDHRERGAIEAGLGYLAQQAGHLDEAQRRYLLALREFTLGRWPWAMHVQYNNLAAVSFNLHAQGLDQDRVLALSHLDEAIVWTTEALEFAEQMDFGGAVDLEVNLAYAYRLKGNLKLAAEWVRRAGNIARAGGNLTDLACALAEQAEVEEAQGQRAEAVQTLTRATALLKEVGSGTWADQAQRRLDELEGRRPETAALKLW